MTRVHAPLGTAVSTGTPQGSGSDIDGPHGRQVTGDAAGVAAKAHGGGPDRRCGWCGQPLGFWAVDKLTGLMDRWGWDEKAPHAFAQACQLGHAIALLIVDLDQFKQVNDEFGHVAGDAVLQAVAAVLRTATRHGDLLGRYGGHGSDEFLVLLPQTSLATALTVARRIREGIKAMTVTARGTDGAVVSIAGRTASIGVAGHVPERHLDLLDLLLEADAALREAKRNGRDQIHLAPSAATGHE